MTSSLLDLLIALVSIYGLTSSHLKLLLHFRYLFTQLFIQFSYSFALPVLCRQNMVLQGIERQQVFPKVSRSVILFESKLSAPFFYVQSPPHFSFVIKAFHTFVLNSALFGKGKIVIYFIVVFSVDLSFETGCQRQKDDPAYPSVLYIAKEIDS